jgi:hypothetical protein
MPSARGGGNRRDRFRNPLARCCVSLAATFILAPRCSPDVLLVPLAIAGVLRTGWLLVKGLDAARLDAR